MAKYLFTRCDGLFNNVTLDIAIRDIDKITGDNPKMFVMLNKSYHLCRNTYKQLTPRTGSP